MKPSIEVTFKYPLGLAVQYRDGEDYREGVITDRRIENGYRVYIIDDRDAITESLLYPITSGNLIQITL